MTYIGVHKWILFLFLTFFRVVQGQVVPFDLGNDTILCEGQSLSLDAGDGFIGYLWNTGDTSQAIIMDTSGIYWCQVISPDSTNLVFNGDFELGNIGFQTDYVYSPEDMWPEGTYTVSWDPSIAHSSFAPCTDHTTGDGLFMIINGSPEPEQIIWMQSVAVTPGMDYNFTFWATSVVSGSPGVLEMRVNGECIETISLNPTTCMWLDLTKTWNSGNNTIAELSILNDNTVAGGNDFGLDDISFVGKIIYADSIQVTFVPEPEFDLGNDTSICIGQSILLDPGQVFEQYLWSDGSTEATLQVFEPGFYSLTVLDEYGCAGTDSISIGLLPGPDITLGNDTVICIGQSIVLSPGNQFETYLWQDNSTLPFYQVISTGIYSVEVTDFTGCTGEAEIYVVVSDPQVDLGPDTLFCENDSLFLSGGGDFFKYQWSTGDTTKEIWINEPGDYGITVEDEFSCQDSDQINITMLGIPWLNMDDQYTICKGDTLILSAPQGNFSYFWNDIEGGPDRSITESGIYNIKILNACGIAEEQIDVIVSPLPRIDLGNDRVLLPGESILLQVSDDFEEYLWNDGSTLNYFVVRENSIAPDDPIFSIEVFDGTCKNSDSVRIELCDIKIPNVFTPNGDSFNDTFSPFEKTWNGISEHTISIYNRWGELVWTSSDFISGWDGRINGRDVSEGTYFWVLDVFIGSREISHTVKGTVTLLR